MGDPSCCSIDDNALVLHLDSPSFEEWRTKFSARATSHLNKDDAEEMQTFPFKKESVHSMRCPDNIGEQERVYRHWRCLPCMVDSEFDTNITGQTVVTRFQRQLKDARKRAAG